MSTLAEESAVETSPSITTTENNPNTVVDPSGGLDQTTQPEAGASDITDLPTQENPATEQPPTTKTPEEIQAEQEQAELEAQAQKTAKQQLLTSMKTWGASDAVITLLEGGLDNLSLEELNLSAMAQWAEHMGFQPQQTEEMLTIEQTLNAGTNPDGTPLTEEQKTALVSKLEEFKQGFAAALIEPMIQAEATTHDLEPKQARERMISLAGLIALALQAGGKFSEFMAEGIKNSNFERFLNAFLQGADYNSITTMSGLEHDGGEGLVSSDTFFQFFRDQPQKGAEKLLEVAKKLPDKINWNLSDEGRKLLEEAQNGTATMARQTIKEFFIGGEKFDPCLIVAITENPANNLAWEQVSKLMAKEVFNKNIVSSAVRKQLEEIHKDPNTAQQFFGE